MFRAVLRTHSVLLSECDDEEGCVAVARTTLLAMPAPMTREAENKDSRRLTKEEWARRCAHALQEREWIDVYET